MKAIIGIDVSKNKLDCLWLRQIEPRKVKTKVFPNMSAGHQQLLDWAQKQTGLPRDKIRFVMEATGIYHERLAYHLYEQGSEVAVLNPAQVRDYAKGIAVRTKTDRKDSLVLALYGAKESLHLWQPEPAEIRKLKELLSRLEALQSDIQREHNRLEKVLSGVSHPEVARSISTVLQGLEQEHKRLEAMIDDHIDNHPQLKNDRQLLESIPGIGPTLSRVMMSVYRARDFEHASQMAAYLGLVPVEQQSGSSVYKRPRLSKAGNASIRAKLYMPAVVACQYNPTAKALYERLLARGKCKMSALCAVMRKLVHLCFGVLKHQQNYSPQAAL
ncbi:MAG: IS110 family transposase [Candidatus Thiodiazotropha sp. (ex. Lucinoma kazani)]|nr:IS110 family transposase [Candidatus Thiodiazotropha sp. (ex Lucinoma borealis)]MCU7867824.1 IS110 family transposase [Candidatus Thiodiazotropha sp. (ex Lucinoma borealis)]MCU7867992.1 IS110 family transposase [Candidatus Thiodiazotropha sp. (ex Lucinoma borealis)]MCU7868005.1 IS110 family transposase [Candidatus Thiodiazotropha sp. (ex Lucinoma borealis)]MCU7868988.1 IS110 family transposase [Candidatus Thiodiazotropha sp. (ex Lucinoma borealis)]